MNPKAKPACQTALVLVVVVALPLAACAARSTALLESGSSPTGSFTPGDEPGEFVYVGDTDGGPPVDWSEPPIDGISVSSIEEAEPYLPFQPILPEGLSATPAIFLSNPEAVPIEDRVLVLMYEESQFGRFYLTEAVSQTSYPELEALADACAQEVECGNKLSIVTLDDGDPALLIAGSVATSIVALKNDVRIDVLGPPLTFSPDNAIVVANMLI